MNIYQKCRHCEQLQDGKESKDCSKSKSGHEWIAYSPPTPTKEVFPGANPSNTRTDGDGKEDIDLGLDEGPVI